MLAQRAPPVPPSAKRQHASESAVAPKRLGHASSDTEPRPAGQVDRPAAGAEASEGEARAAEQRVAQLRREIKLAAAVEDFARAAQLQVQLRALGSSAGSGEGGQEAVASCATPARTSATANPAAALAAKPAAATKPKENRPRSSHQGKEQLQEIAKIAAKGATTSTGTCIS